MCLIVVYKILSFCSGLCRPLDSPPDGSIEYSLIADENNEYLAGTIATFMCSDGFELFGYMTRACQQNMTWSSDSPSCLGKIPFICLLADYCLSINYTSVVSCSGLSGIESGSIEYTTSPNADGNFHSGTIVSYSCVDDFRIVGTDTRVCEPNMNWSGEVPTCERK